jgi:hypothetical protein
MTSYTVPQVFVPGGMPILTYVRRAEKRLEESVAAAKENLCKLVTVTGMTKSGKTVLVSKIFPKTKDAIWVNGGVVGKKEDDFWNSVLAEIDGYTDTGQEDSTNSSYQIEGQVDVQLGLPFIASGKALTKTGHERGRGKRRTRHLSLSPRAAAISQLAATRRPLVIDDFHYLERDFQGEIIRALKPLIFDAVPIILIAIPHRRYDAVKVEREITGRIESVVVPAWDYDELLQISHEGFKVLNMNVSDTPISLVGADRP